MSRESADFPGASWDKTTALMARMDVGGGMSVMGPGNRPFSRAHIYLHYIYYVNKYAKQYAEYAKNAKSFSDMQNM